MLISGSLTTELNRCQSGIQTATCMFQFCVMNFVFSLSQHHCRKCGAVVCGACSNRKFLLPYQAERPLRVCISCYDALTAAQAEADRCVVLQNHNSLYNDTLLSLPPSLSDLDHHLRPLSLPHRNQITRYMNTIMCSVYIHTPVYIAIIVAGYR